MTREAIIISAYRQYEGGTPDFEERVSWITKDPNIKAGEVVTIKSDDGKNPFTGTFRVFRVEPYQRPTSCEVTFHDPQNGYAERAVVVFAEDFAAGQPDHRIKRGRVAALNRAGAVRAAGVFLAAARHEFDEREAQ